MSFEVVCRAVRCIDPDKLSDDMCTELASIMQQLAEIAHKTAPLELRALEIAIAARSSHSKSTLQV